MQYALDWTSSESYLYINPKLPVELKNAVSNFERPNLLAHIWLTSSGTTSAGEVKLIALSKRAFLKSAEAVNKHLNASYKDIWLNTLPHFHVGGLGIFARASLLKNAVVDISEQAWSAEIFHKILISKKITLTSLVPAQLHDLVQLGKLAPEKLRAIVVGGAALSPALYFKARDLGYPVLPSFGMTELCSQIATADMASLSVKGKIYPKLKVLSHCEVRTNAASLLEVRSEATSSFVCRLNAEKVLEQKSILEGQWFLTGDKVKIQNNELEFIGRTGSAIKILGELVQWNELSHLLSDVLYQMDIQSPERMATLVLREDSRRQHKIVLVLDKSLWRHADEIARRWNAKVLPVAKLREIYFLPRLPLTALSKIAVGEIEKLLF